MIIFYLPLSAHANLCAIRGAELARQQKKLISCREVDFEVKAISADYQSKRTEPAAVYPTKIRVDLNEGRLGDFVDVNPIPGIKNSLFFNPIVGPLAESFEAVPAAGFSLLSKFTSVMTQMKANSPEDSEFLNWLNDRDSGLPSQLVPDATQESWVGRCDVWSAWSIDPEVRRLLDRSRFGLMCGDVPLSRGELKELFTLFYSRPRSDFEINLIQFFSGGSGESAEEIEDANMALVKLGVWGADSEFHPDSLIDLGIAAKAAGQNLIVDLGRGREVWNHPVENVVDLEFEDLRPTPPAGHVLDDYLPIGDEGETFFSSARAAANDLQNLALNGDSRPSQPLFGLAAQLDLSIEAQTVSLSRQVDLFEKLMVQASARGWIRLKRDKVKRHLLMIQYGIEGRFADSEDQGPRTRIMEYTIVGDQGRWTPAIRKLKDACQWDDFRLERKSDCNQEHLSESGESWVISGALPPKNFQFMRVGSGAKTGMKGIAYDRLIRMVTECPLLDEGVVFLRELDETLNQGIFSPTVVTRLSQEFDTANRKGLLDTEFVNSKLKRTVRGGVTEPNGKIDLRLKIQNLQDSVLK